jgi:hypothetical protein
MSSEMFTDVSEERAASIFRVEVDTLLLNLDNFIQSHMVSRPREWYSFQ